MPTSLDNPNKKAVVLLSGGLDSTTCLALARSQGFSCYALSFDYGQRHRFELTAARQVVSSLRVIQHQVVAIDMTMIGGSALTDTNIEVPQEECDGIPVTYVPARNTVFLSYALAWAEVLGANDIYIGVNSMDYSGYPDCRQEYVTAFEKMANLATKSAVEGARLRIRTPLIDLSKAEIITLGLGLNVDYSLTVSCYQADDHGRACGACDSCRLRRKGFVDAGIPDPTLYREQT